MQHCTRAARSPSGLGLCLPVSCSSFRGSSVEGERSRRVRKRDRGPNSSREASATAGCSQVKQGLIRASFGTPPCFFFASSPSFFLPFSPPRPTSRTRSIVARSSLPRRRRKKNNNKRNKRQLRSSIDRKLRVRHRAQIKTLSSRKVYISSVVESHRAFSWSPPCSEPGGNANLPLYLARMNKAITLMQMRRV